MLTLFPLILLLCWCYGATAVLPFILAVEAMLVGHFTSSSSSPSSLVCIISTWAWLIRPFLAISWGFCVVVVAELARIIGGHHRILLGMSCMMASIKFRPVLYTSIIVLTRGMMVMIGEEATTAAATGIMGWTVIVMVIHGSEEVTGIIVAVWISLAAIYMCQHDIMKSKLPIQWIMQWGCRGDELIWMICLREFLYPNPGVVIWDRFAFPPHDLMWGVWIPFIGLAVATFMLTRVVVALSAQHHATPLESLSHLLTTIIVALAFQRIVSPTTTTHDSNVVAVNAILLLCTIVCFALSHIKWEHAYQLWAVMSASLLLLLVLLVMGITSVVMTNTFTLSTTTTHQQQPTTWFESSPRTDCLRAMSLNPGFWRTTEFELLRGKKMPYAIDQFEFSRWACPLSRKDVLKNKRMVFVGDSVLRWLHFAAVNTFRDDKFGFPPAKYHADLQSDESITFVWAPFASDLIEFASNATVARERSRHVTFDARDDDVILVLGNGPWDMLHRRDANKYEMEIAQAAEEIGDLLKSSSSATCVWVEFAKLDPDRMLSLEQSEKRTFLTEEKATRFRIAGRDRFEEIGCLVLPLLAITNEVESRDGVHYSAVTYEAGVGVMERMIDGKMRAAQGDK